MIRSITLVSLFTAAAGLLCACGSSAQDEAIAATSEIVRVAEARWGPLNPARGDDGPQAGALWGDRTVTGPSGFLVRFSDGFSSPPHIHNISYRGIVIRGSLHNDDPAAAKMWLSPGSFWTQPAGEAHITAAAGADNLAYVEIERGPYLVLPVDESAETGERAVNVDRSNLVWVDGTSLDWIDGAGAPTARNRPAIAFLWGKPQAGELHGTLVKLPANFNGSIRNHEPGLRGVVIAGSPRVGPAGTTAMETLDPGSYFGAQMPAVHRIVGDEQGETLVYVRTVGRFDVVPAASGQ